MRYDASKCNENAIHPSQLKVNENKHFVRLKRRKKKNLDLFLIDPAQTQTQTQINQHIIARPVSYFPFFSFLANTPTPVHPHSAPFNPL